MVASSAAAQPIRPYAEAALDWFNAGWSPLPLPVRKKAPVPDGYTGYDGALATRAQVRRWISNGAGAGNIAIRLPETIIGIDVDVYDAKHGDVTLEALEETYGPLPPTIRVSARGQDSPGGIRLFKIREGAKFPGVLGPGIEVIQFHHRYFVAPGSWNPKSKSVYEAFDDRTTEVLTIFAPDDVAYLPDAWHGAEAVDIGAGLDKSTHLAPEQLRAWKKLPQHAGQPCRAMRNVRNREIEALAAAESSGAARYDTAVHGSMALVRLAAEGHLGLSAALNKLRGEYLDSIADERDRDGEGEWRRMVDGAVEAVYSTAAEPHGRVCPDRPAASGADALWPAPGDPDAVAERLLDELWTLSAGVDAPRAGESVSGPPMRTLIRWRKDFYEWTGSHWSMAEPEALEARIRRVLRAAEYVKVGANGEAELMPFRLTMKLLAEIMSALRSAVLRPEGIEPDAYSGEGARLIPFPSEMMLLYPSGEWEMVSHSPERFTLYALPFDYVEDAKCPSWLRFLDEIWKDDQEAIEALQQWFGYVISGDTSHQKMLLIKGPKRSGKGTIANILVELLGPANCTETSLMAMANDKYAKWSMIGKLLCTMPDERFRGSSAAVVTDLLKISGGDPITVARKYLPDWYGSIGARFMVLSNELPSLNDASGALASRFVGPLIMTESFVGREDRKLFARLRAELPGILNWALDGLASLSADGQFLAPVSAAEAARDMEELSSPETGFAREWCKRDRNNTERLEDLYAAFRSYRRKQGTPDRDVPAQPVFARNLYAAFPDLAHYRTTKGFDTQTQVVRGIRLIKKAGVQL